MIGAEEVSLLLEDNDNAEKAESVKRFAEQREKTSRLKWQFQWSSNTASNTKADRLFFVQTGS